MVATSHAHHVESGRELFDAYDSRGVGNGGQLHGASWTTPLWTVVPLPVYSSTPASASQGHAEQCR